MQNANGAFLASRSLCCILISGQHLPDSIPFVISAPYVKLVLDGSYVNYLYDYYATISTARIHADSVSSIGGRLKQSRPGA